MKLRLILSAEKYMTPPFFGYAFLLMFLLAKIFMANSRRDYESSAFGVLFLLISGIAILGFFVFDWGKFRWPPKPVSVVFSFFSDALIFLVFYWVLNMAFKRGIGFEPLHWFLVSVFYCAVLQMFHRLIGGRIQV